MWTHRFTVSWLPSTPGSASPTSVGSTAFQRSTAVASLSSKVGVDRRGRPTPAALEAEAASCAGTHGQGRTVFWSRAICSELLESKGYAPMSRNVQIEQWTQLLEALQLGSPSISATPDQMAEEMPTELVEDVNQQLAVRGCSYRVSRHQRQASRSASAC